MTTKKATAMKWWGWGNPNVEFDIENRPGLWPYMLREFKMSAKPPRQSPVEERELTLPPAKENADFLRTAQAVLGAESVRIDDDARRDHAYGKSFRDLWRIRHGIVKRAPDCVLYPRSTEETAQIVKLADTHNVVVIPFGGGSNIVGGVESPTQEQRMIAVLNMRLLNHVAVDHDNMTATVGGGILGPELEQALNAEGVTLGHFPDSFEYSSLGGWVATRSAGMFSDRYGKIEDMVLALSMVTPTGKITTRQVPKASNGIDVNRLCIGSEGVLGVITDITVMIHPLPRYKRYYGFLFRDFEAGARAVKATVDTGNAPVMMRLNDAKKTQLSFAFKTRGGFISRHISRIMKYWLGHVKKIDFEQCCIMLICCAGRDKDQFKRQYRGTKKIFARHGAVALGTSPGRSFEQSKYDFPYMRDHVMDYGMVADVSETATVWNNLLPLYYRSTENINRAVRAVGAEPWVGCHISHSYHSGASLYFTFGFFPDKPEHTLNQYWQVKRAAEQSFIDGGATLSHHHAVGYEHAPWLTEDIGAPAVAMIAALKAKTDPHNIMNPGKYIGCTPCDKTA